MKHFETNWRKSLFNSMLETKEKEHLSISQRQTIIKLIEKKAKIRDS